MKLQDYLRFRRIKNKTFAKFLNISPVSLSRYISGERFPEKKILIKIHNLSEGLVSPNDFCLQDDKNYDVNESQKIELKKFHQHILSGSRKHLGKAITLIESSREKDQVTSEKLLELFKGNDKSIRIGITGVPGVGKSTFIESFGMKLIRKGFKVAVLAVDPSSRFSGGSILGDKTRMEKLSVNKNAFIRPSPSSGHLGGVAKRTSESILCLEEAGFNIIFVETMGVGQAETEVYDMVDIFLVLLLPAGGDELQGIKKGIIEMADLIIVNKADGELQKSAEITQREYKNASHITNKSRINEDIGVMICSSLNQSGFENVWKYILKFIDIRKKNNDFINERNLQKINRMWGLVDLKVKGFVKNISSRKFVQELLKNVKTNNLSMYRAVKMISNCIIKK
jgi:LAO/AO transport system kinase